MNHLMPFLVSLIPILLLLLFFLFMRNMRLRSQRSQEHRSDVSFVVETFQDLVCQLKQKEEELKRLKGLAERRADEIESYSNNILQSVPSGVVSFDNDYRVTRVNTSACRILGLNESELVGKALEEVFGPPMVDILKGPGEIKRREFLYRNRKGEEIWLGLSKTGLYDRRGQKIGFIIVFTDITEVKALERQVRLKDHLSSLGEISLGIAHELRNPMAVISGYAKMLMRDRDLRQRPEIRVIYRELQTMNRIIDDFMSFARPVTPTPVEVSLEVMLKELVEGSVKDMKGVEVVYNIELDKVVTDEVLLKQAVTNVVQNALEAMPGGGRLSVSTTKADGFALISISDTGYGIPEEIRERIFQPFFSKKEGGTGLGLAIVQKNVTLLDGRVEVQSSAEGTTFHIYLPLKGPDRRGGRVD